MPRMARTHFGFYEPCGFFSTDFIKHMVAYVANSDAWFAAATLKMTEEHESRFGEHAAFLVAAAQLSYP